MIRVYDAAGKVIEAQKHAGNFKRVVSTLALPSFVFGPNRLRCLGKSPSFMTAAS